MVLNDAMKRFLFWAGVVVLTVVVLENTIQTNKTTDEEYVLENCLPQFEQPEPAEGDEPEYGLVIRASLEPIDWLCPDGTTVRM